MIINGYETTLEELQDMAKNWQSIDIAKHFRVSERTVSITLKKYGITKTKVMRKTNIKPRKKGRVMPEAVKLQFLAEGGLLL